MKLHLLTIAGALILAPQAYAASITGLYNTGVDDAGVALVGTSAVDTHYTIVSSTSPGFAGLNPVTFNCCYFADSATSRWVSLSASGNPGSNTTVYRLSFDLTGFAPSTAAISGQYATDNSGTVSLNGGAQSFASNTFGGYTGFSFDSGFVSGINTLDFTVNDSGAPTAFRVDGLTGTVEASVPEPASWAMMVGGFGLIGAGLRRRRASVSFA